MSKITVHQKRTLLLELPQEMYDWLHAVMQNPLHGESPDSEDPQSSLFRRELFEATRPPAQHKALYFPPVSGHFHTNRNRSKQTMYQEPVQIKFTKVRSVYSPQKAHDTDAGFDFFIPDGTYKSEWGENGRPVMPGESVLIPSGIKMDVPAGYALVFFNKSGIASKRKLLVGAQVVDHGYSGEVFINLHNVGTDIINLRDGEKVVQGLVLPVPKIEMIESDADQMWTNTESERGDGGFGSTDRKVIKS